MLITDPQQLSQTAQLKAAIRQVPDHPKPGICFYDITTLWKSPAMFKLTLDSLEELIAPFDFTKIGAIEARGFVFGAPLADRMKKGFIPLRKAGKLPAETLQEGYNLEYGNDHLEIHQDAIEAGDKVLLIDDLVATGGSLAAAAHLIEHLGGEVSGIACVIALTFLPYLKKLGDYDLRYLIDYDSE